MEESILLSTKKVLGIGYDDDSFDLDVITFINSAFSNLHQLGIGPLGGFFIQGEEETWTDFEETEESASAAMMMLVKTVIYLRTRVMFDPPQTSYLLAAMQQQIAEHEWRLSNLRELEEWSPPLPDPLLIDGGDAPD